MNAWIVLVNQSEAKFFECDLRTQGEVRFVEKIDNPKGRLKPKDLEADRPGYSGSPAGGPGGRLEKPQDPKDRIMKMFAKKVVHRLEEEHRHGTFEELVIIAGPKFLGTLRPLLSKELAAAVVQEIPNNITKVGGQAEITGRVWPNEDEATKYDQGYLN